MEHFTLASALTAIESYLQAGGPVVLAILVSTFVMWTLIIERVFFFTVSERAQTRRKRQTWAARTDRASWYAHAQRNRLISEQRLACEQFMGVIRVMILVTPLLGLLGTVTGMIDVFQVITATNSSNARLMASGISRATIPTMTGLAVSLSGILFINLLERHAAHTVARLADSLDIHHATPQTPTPAPTEDGESA